MGGSTECSSSRVTEAEKGLSHLRSLYHRTSPLVLLSCAGGLWVGVWCHRLMSGTSRADGEMKKTIAKKSEAAITTYLKVRLPGG